MTTRRHAAFETRFPPAEDTFSGRLMLDVAGGLRSRDVLEQSVTDITVHDDFTRYYPNEEPLEHAQALVLLHEVIAEHNRVVTAPSPDALAVDAAFERLRGEGIAVSYAEGWDKGEAASAGFAAARALPGARGYGYATVQDVEWLVIGGRLSLGFSSMSGDVGDDASLDVARRICAALQDQGLAATWSGSGWSRVTVDDLVLQRPFEG